MPIQISKDDFDNWKNSPVGNVFFGLLRDNLDKLAWGNMTQALCRDHIGNAYHVGQFEATRTYFMMDYKELTGLDE